MKKTTVSKSTRVIIFICGLSLLAVLITPIWRIDLQAPQYPEGLKMYIYANKLAGDVNIINGLNHYIGMKTLHVDDFKEFKILPYIIVLFSLMFMIGGIAGKRKWLNIICALFVLFGMIAMVDFYRWEYDYGHHLNPAAAIIVPGMAYQPPLIGFKQLLNFGAYSIPDSGGWIFIGVGIALLSLVLIEWKRNKTIRVFQKPSTLLIIGLITITINSCDQLPQSIRIGKDNCDYCKMTISDNRFGAEIKTKKGKVYKFDDEHCIIAFLNSKKVAEDQIGSIFFTNFSYPHQFIHVEQSTFLQSPNFNSPMNGNIAAFNNEDSLTKVFLHFNGNKISWQEMKK